MEFVFRRLLLVLFQKEVGVLSAEKKDQGLLNGKVFLLTFLLVELVIDFFKITFTPRRLLRPCKLTEARDAVIILMNMVVMISPANIQKTPNTLPRTVLGALSPYLQIRNWTLFAKAKTCNVKTWHQISSYGSKYHHNKISKLLFQVFPSFYGGNVTSLTHLIPNFCVLLSPTNRSRSLF